MSIEKPNFNNYLEGKEADEDRPKSPERREFLKDTGKFMAGAGTAFMVEKGIENKKLLEKLYIKAKNGISEAFKRFRKELGEGNSQKEEGKTVSIDQQQIEKLDSKKQNKIENISDHFLFAYKKLSKQNKYFPAEIFTKDFFIAQQLQESCFNKRAKSNKGAVGIMQVTKPAIQDVSRYLRSLHLAKELKYNGPVYIKKPKKKRYKDVMKYEEDLKKYQNEIRRLDIKEEDILTDEDIDNIMKECMDNADYSRAIGKLYLMKLLDKHKGYNVGQNEYKRGDIRGARRLLLACYNAGTGAVYKNKRVKPEATWPKETRNYVKNVFNYMERIKNIRQSFKENGLNPDWDYAVMNVAYAMNKANKLHGKKREKKLKDIMDKLIVRIKTEQMRNNNLNNTDLNHLFADR